MKRRTASLYRIFNEEWDLLYVGVSNSVIRRLDEHVWEQPWSEEISMIHVEHFENRREAVDAERRAILADQPKYNRAHASHHEAMRRCCAKQGAAEVIPDRLGMVEIAQALGVTRTTAHRYKKQGLIRPKWLGGKWTMTREEVAMAARRMAEIKLSGGKLETGRIG